MLDSVGKIKANPKIVQTIVTSEVQMFAEEYVLETEGQERDENGPWSLWSGLSRPASKKAKETNKKKPPAPTENERLADILTKYGNNPEGIPALQYAILRNDAAAVDLLLKHGASPQTKDFHGADCIYYSVKTGNIQLVKKFLSLGVNPNGKSDADEYKPLGLALENKRNDIAKVLIDSGVDLSKDSKYKADYLRYSCLYTNLEITKLLVERGAKTNNPDLLFRLLMVQNGEQKESLEVRKLKMEMIDYLVRENVIDLNKKINFKGQDFERIIPEALVYCLRNGLLGDLDKWYDHGTLITLVANNQAYATELVQLLLDRIPNLNRPDGKGMTPLHYLVQRTFTNEEEFTKRKDLIKIMISRGADINRGNNQGHTPLIFATDAKMIEFLKTLKAK